jgi:phosphoglycerol transferase MdoB-like AlkP superfamily enzyme
LAIYLIFFRWNPKKIDIKTALFYILIPISIYSIIFLTSNFYRWKSETDVKFYSAPNEIPEFAFTKTLFDYIFFNEEDIVLTQDEIEILTSSFGIQYNNSSEYPFIKNWIYKDSLPFRRLNNNTTQNVVLIFTESLSSCLIGPYSSKMKDVTPFLNKYAKNCCVVHDYYNHTTPTINGLKGQLCSFYGVFYGKEYENHSRPSLENVRSIVHILNEYDYNTIYLSPENTGYNISIRKIMEELGFNDILLKEDLENMASKKSAFYMNDEDLFESSIEYMKNNLENNSPPFFLCISTIGTHGGEGSVAKSVSHQYEDGSNILYNKIYSYDQSVKKLISYIKSSNLSENTIIVITADHSYFPSLEIKEVKEDYSFSTMFDEVCLIIDAPNINLPKEYHQLSSSIDLAPTLLSLLNINNVENHFLGLSIFSDRKNYPSIMGSPYAFFKSDDDITIDNNTLERFNGFFRTILRKNLLYH